MVSSLATAKIRKKLATEITKNFIEVIMARGFDKDALNVLKKEKNLRIIDISNYKFKKSAQLIF